MSEERISELEDVSIDSSKTEKQTKKQRLKKQNRISKDYGATTKGVTYV